MRQSLGIWKKSLMDAMMSIYQRTEKLAKKEGKEYVQHFSDAKNYVGLVLSVLMMLTQLLRLLKNTMESL